MITTMNQPAIAANATAIDHSRIQMKCGIITISRRNTISRYRFRSSVDDEANGRRTGRLHGGRIIPVPRGGTIDDVTRP